MNKAEFSAYYESENEVLIQDGTCLKVNKVEEQKQGKETLTFIQLDFIGHGGFLWCSTSYKILAEIWRVSKIFKNQP